MAMDYKKRIKKHVEEICEWMQSYEMLLDDVDEEDEDYDDLHDAWDAGLEEIKDVYKWELGG